MAPAATSFRLICESTLRAAESIIAPPDLTEDDVNQLPHDSLWTLDPGCQNKHIKVVPVPAGWHQTTEARVREYYFDLVLRLYERDDPTVNAVSSNETTRSLP